MEERNHITLSLLQSKIKQSIESYVKAQWVSCDITDLKVNGTGHCYLELTEKSEGRGAIPKAKSTAIIWRNTFQMIGRYFEKETGYKLQSGIKVLLFVEVNYHELYGLSLIIKDIDPSYTLGDSERLKRETLAQLESDGVIDMNRELELPHIINRLAVISSATAAGYDDFINHLGSNPYDYKFTTELYSAIVQGDGAEESIITALGAVIDSEINYDAIVIIRGGGSQSDMACFNSYMLCSYIAQFPIPILTGIGHNKDISVADRVAHTSLKTPTAVASFIIDTKRGFEERVEYLQQQLANALAYYLERENRVIDNLSQRMRLAIVDNIKHQELRINNLLSALQYGVKEHISGMNHKLSLYEKELISNNPQRILDMGYSMATLNGKLLKSVNDTQSGDEIEITFSDGKVATKVV